MLRTLKRILGFRVEGQEDIQTPTNEDASFTLHFETWVIGYLRLHRGAWQFQYSDEFKKQSEVQPLIDFPDPERVYQSDALWPFFMARIPSVAQPQVQEIIAEEGLDERSDLQLLRRFGERTISNPFVLLEVS